MGEESAMEEERANDPSPSVTDDFLPDRKPGAPANVPSSLSAERPTQAPPPESSRTRLQLKDELCFVSHLLGTQAMHLGDIPNPLSNNGERSSAAKQMIDLPASSRRKRRASKDEGTASRISLDLLGVMRETGR
jgi:hypothetical protein